MTDIKKMEGYLVEICSNVKSDRSEELEHMWYKKGLGVAYLNENEIEKFEAVIDELYTDDYIKSNFPRSYLRNEFQNIILEALQKSGVDRSEFISNELGELRSKLKKDIKKFNFIIPISNLKIENNFNIGNVTFKKFDEAKNIIEKIFNPNGDKERQQTLEQHYNYLAPTCAEVSVQGVPIFAQSEAYNRIRLAVNSLKLYNRTDDPVWGIKGEILTPNLRMTFSYENEEAKDNPGSKISLGRVGPPKTYKITSKTLELMNRHHFNTINQILNKSRNNDLETRLLTSIYWFGESLSTPFIEEEKDVIYKKKKLKHQNLEYFRLGERLIKLFTALEAILIFDKTDPVTESILERTPLLLSTDPKQRIDCQACLEKLYEKRSQIVHYGNTGVSHQDVHILTQIVRTILFALLKMSEDHEFKNLNSLKDHLDVLKSCK